MQEPGNLFLQCFVVVGDIFCMVDIIMITKEHRWVQSYVCTESVYYDIGLEQKVCFWHLPFRHDPPNLWALSGWLEEAGCGDSHSKQQKSTLSIDRPFLSAGYLKSRPWNDVSALNLLLRCSYLILDGWAKAFLGMAEMWGHTMGVCPSWVIFRPPWPRTSPSLWHHSTTSPRLAVNGAAQHCAWIKQLPERPVGLLRARTVLAEQRDDDTCTSSRETTWKSRGKHDPTPF